MGNTFGSNLKRIREARGLSQEQIAQILNTSKQVISRYETNQRSPKIDTVADYAKKLHVPLTELTGYVDNSASEANNIESLRKYGILPIETKKIPLLGDVICGEPRFAEEDFECYVECGVDIHADFALRAVGDSMVNARIHDGDIVFVRQQPTVNNGEIAVVLIGEDTTLKRFNRYGDTVVLRAENPAYEDIVIDLDSFTQVRILGKAIAFQSDVR